VQHASGVDPEYLRCGMVLLDSVETDQALRWAGETGSQVETRSMQQVYAQEPELNACFARALWMPQVGHVRNPRLLAGLRTLLMAHAKCELIEHQSVQKLVTSGSKIIEVETQERTYGADQFLIATGAWSSALLKPIGLDLPIEPVKGQMLIFEPRPGLIHSMIMFEGRYLLPRADGRIIAGSTLEYTGFDKSTTEEARRDLLNAACQMVPVLEATRIEHQWAGLRPGSPLGVPYIGRFDAWDNLFINAGHFRNGLVLAPASARLIVDLMLEQEPVIDPVAYDPNRAVDDTVMI
jgi:glycine oxidase